MCKTYTKPSPPKILAWIGRTHEVGPLPQELSVMGGTGGRKVRDAASKRLPRVPGHGPTHGVALEGLRRFKRGVQESWDGI